MLYMLCVDLKFGAVVIWHAFPYYLIIFVTALLFKLVISNHIFVELHLLVPYLSSSTRYLRMMSGCLNRQTRIKCLYLHLVLLGLLLIQQLTFSRLCYWRWKISVLPLEMIFHKRSFPSFTFYISGSNLAQLLFLLITSYVNFISGCCW